MIANNQNAPVLEELEAQSFEDSHFHYTRFWDRTRPKVKIDGESTNYDEKRRQWCLFTFNVMSVKVNQSNPKTAASQPLLVKLLSFNLVPRKNLLAPQNWVFMGFWMRSRVSKLQLKSRPNLCHETVENRRNWYRRHFFQLLFTLISQYHHWTHFFDGLSNEVSPIWRFESSILSRAEIRRGVASEAFLF